MAEAQNNKPVLHRKEWQTMMPAPVAVAAGYFVVNDNANTARFAMYMNAAATPYLYDHEQDDWLPIAASGLAPAVAAGACGCYTDWSIPFTANGGSTTTITVAAATHNINGYVVGCVVEFTSGNNKGLRRNITEILALGGAGNIKLTFDSAVGTAVANADTFRIASGSFWILTTGTLTTTSFKQFDIATMAWVSKAITGLPAWGTDGRLAHPGMLGVSYDTGTAAVSSNTTNLDCTGKTWTADQWINYQCRITGGTGCGQIKVITDNDTDTLIFSAGTDLDDTSTFVIEGDEDAIYAAGNNAKILYKYSIAGGTWATVTVSPARANNAIAGMSLDFVGVTGDAGWANTSDIKDGRYLYSFDGGTSVLARYDIALQAWSAITYQPSLLTIAAGAGTDWSGMYIYIGKEGSTTVPQRFYKYNVVYNTMKAVTTDWYLGGAPLIGNKIWVRSLSSSGLVKWLYVLQSSLTIVRRIMLF